MQSVIWKNNLDTKGLENVIEDNMLHLVFLITLFGPFYDQWYYVLYNSVFMIWNCLMAEIS